MAGRHSTGCKTGLITRMVRRGSFGVTSAAARRETGEGTNKRRTLIDAKVKKKKTRDKISITEHVYKWEICKRLAFWKSFTATQFWHQAVLGLKIQTAVISVLLVLSFTVWICKYKACLWPWWITDNEVLKCCKCTQVVKQPIKIQFIMYRLAWSALFPPNTVPLVRVVCMGSNVSFMLAAINLQYRIFALLNIQTSAGKDEGQPSNGG